MHALFILLKIYLFYPNQKPYLKEIPKQFHYNYFLLKKHLKVSKRLYFLLKLFEIKYHPSIHHKLHQVITKEEFHLVHFSLENNFGN